MRLNNIISSNGSNRPKRRRGKGVGSGHGKTSGRGHKGARARSGFSLRPGFESGHIPLFRRLPMRGFSNFKFRKGYAVVNVGDLERMGEGSVVNRESLERAGLVRKDGRPVKLLGDGEIARAFEVQIDKVSASAKAKIEAAGGKVVGKD